MADLRPRRSFPRPRFTGPEVFLLATLIPFGLLAIVLLPLGAGNDEETHMERVWEMSAFHFLPNERLGTPDFPYPILLREVSYRRQVLIRPVGSDYWTSLSGRGIDADGYYYGPLATRSGYSPPLLLPQALVMRYLGRRFDLPLITVYYAVRLAGLMTYLVLAWLAVRLIPFGKWTLAVLSVAPAALLQASSVSPDAISNGIALLFIGNCLAVASRRPVRLGGMLSLLVALALLFLAKLNTVVLAVLPFMLLRPAAFKRRSLYGLLAVGALSLFLIEAVGWYMVASGRYGATMAGSDPVGQLRHILTGPGTFVQLLFQDALANGLRYFQGWIASYGYDYWAVPLPVFLFLITALAASLIIARPGEPDRRTRLSLTTVFFLGYLATVISLYVAFSPLGSGTIFGVNGRYLIATSVPLWLALVGVVRVSGARWPAVAAVSSATSLIFFLGGAYLSYHVPCGTHYYQTGLCYQPFYKNFAPDDRFSPPMHGGFELVQEISPECGNVSEVRLWVDSSQADPESRLTMIVRDPANDRNLFEGTVLSASLPRRGWVQLPFSPQTDSEGALYLVKIHGESDDGVGPRFAYTARPEMPSVKLYEAGVESPVDLVFQYGCLAGLEKLREDLLPSSAEGH